MSDPAQRVFSRVFFDAPCQIRRGEQCWRSQVLDISLRGALLREPPGFEGEADDYFDLIIELGDGAVTINMEAALRHRGDQCLGFECMTLDLDSATHLRRLIELNLGDEAELHREIGRLGSD